MFTETGHSGLKFKTNPSLFSKCLLKGNFERNISKLETISSLERIATSVFIYCKLQLGSVILISDVLVIKQVTGEGVPENTVKSF